MQLRTPALLLSAIALFWYSCKSDVDTDMPYILLDGDNPYYIDSIGGGFSEPGFSAVDDVDGDITNKVQVTYPLIMPDSARSYEAVYTVSDKSGNVFTTRRTIIVRNTSHIIEGFFSRCNQVRNDTIIDTLFTASVLPSIVTNNEFYISNFGNFGYGNPVLASLNQTTKRIIINTPQTLADSSTLDLVDADSSYYYFVNDTLRFQIYYTRTKNGQQENCRSYYVK